MRPKKTKALAYKIADMMNRSKCTRMCSTKTLTFTLININDKPLLCAACMCAIKS